MLSLIFVAALGVLSLTILSRPQSDHLSDLRKVPKGHFSTSFTRLWILWVRWQGRENRTRLELHRRLGPVVRIGPRELSIDCMEGGVRLIYGSEFAKTAWYPQAYFGVQVPYMFTMMGKDDHAARKKLLSAVYTKSFIMTSYELEDSISVVLDRLGQNLGSWANGDAVDVLQQMRACMMDITTLWLYGKSAGTNFLQDAASRDRFLLSWRRSGGGFFWRSEFPQLTRLLQLFGIHMVPKVAKSSLQNVQLWGAQMTAKASNSSKSPEASVYQHLRNNFEKAFPQTAQMEGDMIMSTELLDHAIASHDVGGITLTYVMYELSKHQDKQRALRAELKSLNKSSESSDKSLPQCIDSLPLLDAIIMETLRLHAPSPGPLPRVVPKHGCRVAGSFNIPPGTIVSATGYTLHRNPVVFPSPTEWRPERWLVADELGQTELRKWFWAFGSGARMCIGIHFAIRVIKAILVQVYTDHETILDDDHPLDQADATIAGPISNSLYLRVCSYL